MQVGLLKEMISGTSLLLRVTPFSESAVTLECTISGLDEAIKPLRKSLRLVAFFHLEGLAGGHRPSSRTGPNVSGADSEQMSDRRVAPIQATAGEGTDKISPSRGPRSCKDYLSQQTEA
jgi:hypothetical protein